MNAKEIIQKELERQAEFGYEPNWEDFVVAGYAEGFRSALRLFAWWKDGVQYVGTTGTTLKDALEAVDKVSTK